MRDKSSYSATVTVTDGTNSSNQNINVAVNDMNDAPTLDLDVNCTHTEINQSVCDIGSSVEDEDGE